MLFHLSSNVIRPKWKHLERMYVLYALSVLCNYLPIWLQIDVIGFLSVSSLCLDCFLPTVCITVILKHIVVK